MPAKPEETNLAGRSAVPDGITVQILLDLKNSDPTALTAAEAIRNLLGFGDRLVEIRRRSLHELMLRVATGREGRAALPDLLSAYLEATVVFWNPNKQRAWVRVPQLGTSGAPWEARSGARRLAGDFGAPDLSRPEYDHLLVWPRGDGAIPADLPRALPGWEVAAAGQGELWSLRWQEGAPVAERTAWTDAVGAARSRREGLLLNPHAQHHRILSGAVPIPLWSAGASEIGGAA